MEIILDSDVQAVAEFMQGRLPTARLVAVAEALSSLAPILWGKYQPEAVEVLRLRNSPLTTLSCEPRIQPTSSV